MNEEKVKGSEAEARTITLSDIEVRLTLYALNEAAKAKILPDPKKLPDLALGIDLIILRLLNFMDGKPDLKTIGDLKSALERNAAKAKAREGSSDHPEA